LEIPPSGKLFVFTLEIFMSYIFLNFVFSFPVSDMTRYRGETKLRKSQNIFEIKINKFKKYGICWKL